MKIEKHKMKSGNGYALIFNDGNKVYLTSSEFADVVRFGNIEAAKEEIEMHYDGVKEEGYSDLYTERLGYVVGDPEKLQRAAERLLHYCESDYEENGDSRAANLESAISYALGEVDADGEFPIEDY